MRELEIRDEGERLIPEAAYGSISYAEHIARYHFASQFVRAKRVLDVASGVGYGADLLKRNATRVVAADNSLEAAQYGSKHHANYGPDFLVSDAEALALRGGQFDVVVSFETIEHVPHYDRLLKEVKRVLHKEGLLIISTPNKGVYPEGNRFHVNEFALEEFEEVLRRHFSNVTILAQQNWVMSSILSLDAMEERDAPVAGPVTAFKVAGLPRVSTLYTVALCSNGPLPEAAAQTLELSGLYQTAVGEKDSHIINIEAALADTQAALAPVQVARDELQAALAEKDAVLAQKDAHIVDIETALYQANVQAAAAQHQLNLITGSAGYRLLELIRRPIRWLAPQGSRRHLGVKAGARGLNILVSEGPWTLVRRAVPVWRWLPRLRRGFVVQQGATLDDQYQLWLKAHELTPARTRRIRRAAASLAYRPLVSIVMPVYNPDPAWLRDAIESVRAQLYDNWELCIADDGSTRAGVRELLEQYQRDEPRTKVTCLTKNVGIAAASNAALALATGEFVGLLDHDDELKPDALFEVAKLLNERRDLDYVYSDEDKLETDGRLVEPFFKPDWSPDLLMSVNYVTHFSVFRKEIIDKVGGFRPGYDGSQDYDLVLRVTETTGKVAHIPKPLYTWRKVPGSAAGSTKAKSFAFRAGKKALKDALSRRGIKGEVLNGLAKGRYRVKYDITGNPKVAIIIPTRDRVDMLRRCVDSIKKKSSYGNYEIIIVDNNSQEAETLDYLSSFSGRVIKYPHEFSFAKIVNLGAREADCDALLFLNNDTEIITPDWIEAMLEHGQRPDVAAVGARLLYPDGRVQHEGVMMGLGGGSAGNVDHGGYFALGETPHNSTAVTAACMLTRPSVFRELGGFDERLRVAFNDVDFCLRAREKGYFIVYTPYATLYHYESATRGRLHPQEDERFFRNRWGDPGEYRDPYYNPNLDLRYPFTIRV